MPPERGPFSLAPRPAKRADVSKLKVASWNINSVRARTGLVEQLIGEEQPDIRVKRDQGERVGGGAVGIDEGSFNDDTIWYRGRHITGGAATDPIGTYVSTGS